MIIDWYHIDEDEPALYVRTRGADGVLHEKHILPGDTEYVKPFCWFSQSAPPYVMKRLERWNGLTVRRDVTAKGLDGKDLFMVQVDRPTMLWELKETFDNLTYEADLNYLDQFLIETYPDKIPEFKPRVWYFDLEWDTGDDDFTTVMAVVDTFLRNPVVFAWSQESNRQHITGGFEDTVEWIDRHGGYELRTYGSEHNMHEGFLKYLDECDPDILIAHAITWADLPHMYKRLGTERSRLSPLDQVLAPNKKTGAYRTTAQPIKGRLIFDTAAPWTDGSGFENVWQKSGRGQAQKRSLDWFATELELGEKLTNRVKGMTVHNGWYDYYDDFVDYCLVDTTLLRDIDEKLNCLNFHLAMQQMAGVSFGSTHKVTRYFRGLIGRHTDIKAPSSYIQERPDLQAAWVMPPVAGRHEGVALLDFASLYPNIIMSDNLCWTTKVDGPGENVRSLGNGTHWRTDIKGILPSVVEQMLALRKKYKQLHKEADDADTKLGYHMLQMAVKVAVNALYGMCASKRVGGMWSDYDIARSITYRGREAINMLVDESEKRGMKALAGHTDSVYVKTDTVDAAKELCTVLTQIAQEDMGMSYLDVEFEAFFDYWITSATKNRNFGIKTYPPEEAGDMKVTGFAMKAASSAPITKEIQKTVFRLVGTGAEEEEVAAKIRPMVVDVYTGKVDVKDVAAYGRLSKTPCEYRDSNGDSWKGSNGSKCSICRLDRSAHYTSVVPNSAKAARYYNKHVAGKGDEFGKGDSSYWLFVNGVPEGKPATNVTAFNDEKDLEGFSVDWSTTVDKWVTAKLTNLYETLNWDLDSVVTRYRPNRLW